MKKTILKFMLGMAFCIFCFAGKTDEVKADLIYWPEDDFAVKHTSEVAEERRDYEVSEQAVESYISPEHNTPSGKVKKGDLFTVYYLYKDKTSDKQWGCIDKDFWVPMDNMKRLYDGIDFEKEHLNEIRSYAWELNQYEVHFPITFYEYPGSDKVTGATAEDYKDSETVLKKWLEPEKVYEDEEGKLWGYINTYHWGYRKGWYCISDFPQNAIRDYDGDGFVDLSDAFTVLKAALKIEDRVKYTLENKNYVYTLKDAQLVLKAALKIPYELPHVVTESE